MNAAAQKKFVPNMVLTDASGLLGVTRAITLMGIALLAGCTAAPQPASQPAAALSPHKPNVARMLQNHWYRCLEQSYRTARTQTLDKNFAAEMAFQACASEEQDLFSFANEGIPPGYSVMPHVKAETKRLLIEEGHLPIYSEQ